MDSMPLDLEFQENRFEEALKITTKGTFLNQYSCKDLNILEGRNGQKKGKFNFSTDLKQSRLKL